MIIECHHCKAKVNAESHGFVETEDLFTERTYLLQCPACKSVLIGESSEIIFPTKGGPEWTDLVRVYPKPRRLLGNDVPDAIRISLEEAEKCMQSGACVAAAAMAGRALEGLCRHFGTKGSYLSAGIKELHKKGLIDTRLLEWSEELRDIRNSAAHATDVRISSRDAEDILVFAYAIFDYVFLLTKKFDEYKERKIKENEKKKG